jgi:hypothetical protein
MKIGQPNLSERKDQSNLKGSVNGAIHAGLSAIILAHALGVTPARINDIVRERHGIEKPHPENVGFLMRPTYRHKDCNNSGRSI